MTIMGCEVIERHVLSGLDIAVKSGDKLYVWPGFVPSKELKYIEVPTMEELWEEEFNKRLELYFAPPPRTSVYSTLTNITV